MSVESDPFVALVALILTATIIAVGLFLLTALRIGRDDK